jgi:hypothetical protein|tara:strand:- start:969 stop:1202 length:234 start_codon:yes stop_codon:yes gene_type:complete
MPPKFKPSHKEYVKGPDGRPTKRTRMKHYYLAQTSTQEIIDGINKGKRKHRNKFINELTRRGVKLVWKTEDEIATEQ